MYCFSLFEIFDIIVHGFENYSTQTFLQDEMNCQTELCDKHVECLACTHQIFAARKNFAPNKRLAEKISKTKRRRHNLCLSELRVDQIEI